jgi:hypothetical protein
LSIVYGLVACGLGLVAFWAARSMHVLRRRVLGWPSVRGHVTSREVIRPADRGRLSAPAFRFAPDVRYTYRVDGVDYVGDKTTLPWSATGSRTSAEKVLAAIPDQTDVRYDPDDPKTSCLYPPGRKNVVIYALGGVLALLLGAVYAAS